MRLPPLRRPLRQKRFRRRIVNVNKKRILPNLTRHCDAATRATACKSVQDDVLQHLADGDDDIEIASAPTCLRHAAAERAARRPEIFRQGDKGNSLRRLVHSHFRSSSTPVKPSNAAL